MPSETQDFYRMELTMLDQDSIASSSDDKGHAERQPSTADGIV